MEGLGNDFVVLDELDGSPARGARIDAALARRLCDRRFGVGADQILRVQPAQGKDADFRMEILNSDGSAAEMCGNGIRAVAVLLARKGRLKDGAEARIETLAGLKRVRLEGGQVVVDMGPPAIGSGFGAGFPGEALDDPGVRFYEVGMGNPHAVIFPAGPLAAVPLELWGPRIESHARFPRRTNVEFVAIEGPSRIRVRVWERGAGVTLACGTGACASAVAALATQRVKGAVEVELPGGKLEIRWEGGNAPVFMKGPAREVFRGEFEL